MLFGKKIDLRKSSLKFFEKFDTIVNCAATTSGSKDITSQPYIHVTDNAIMNARILQAAYDAKINNFIFLSCTVMYPSNSIHNLQVETVFTVPTTSSCPF